MAAAAWAVAGMRKIVHQKLLIDMRCLSVTFDMTELVGGATNGSIAKDASGVSAPCCGFVKPPNSCG